MQLRASRFRPRRAAAFAAVALLALAPASASARDADQPSPRQALERAEQASRGELRGREQTLVNRDLFLAVDELGPRARARARRLMARPTDPSGDSRLVFGNRPVTRTCSTNFCVHYVTDSGDDDAPPALDVTGIIGRPDYVEAMLDQFETVRQRENTQLGWPAPLSDGVRGGDGRLDVYVGNIGKDDGPYGYAQSEGDPNDRQVTAYMVMDNDYSEFNNPDYLVSLQVTAAHEYNHVLQMGIDVLFDPWFGEATATWMEEQVYPNGNDWLNYLRAWASAPEVPLTVLSDDPQAASSLKPYGSSVFLHWLSDQPSIGANAILDGWLATPEVQPDAYAIAALDAGLAAHGGPTSSQAFGAFSAASAEWRASDSGFHDREHYKDYPLSTHAGVDVARAAALGDGDTRTDPIDHTGYRLYDVPANGTDAVRLNVVAPAGVASSIALVGRTGGIDTGTVTIKRTELPSGGKGSVILNGLGSFSRVTAVVANADTAVSGWSNTLNDWTFAGDGRSYTLTATKDLSDPVEPVPADPTPVDPPVTTPTVPSPPAPTPTPAPASPKLVVPSKATTLTALRGLGASLARQLKTRGIPKLRSTRPAFAFAAPSAGRLDVRVVVGGTTVSSVRTDATRAGRLKARLKATPSGRRLLLRGGSRKTATVVLRFTPKGAPAQELRRRITIRR